MLEFASLLLTVFLVQLNHGTAKTCFDAKYSYHGKTSNQAGITVYNIHHHYLALKCSSHSCLEYLQNAAPQTSGECLAEMQIVDFSDCRDCRWSEFREAFKPFRMQSQAYNWTQQGPWTQYIQNVLDLSNCSFSDNEVGRWNFLDGPHNGVTILKLSGNQIKALRNNGIFQSPPNLPNLEELWLDNNRITSISLFEHYQLPRLKFLTLHNNNLNNVEWRDFKFWPGDLPALEFLDLDKTSLSFGISHFYTVLVRLEHLKYLIWHKNSTSCSCRMIRAISRNLPDVKVWSGSLEAWSAPTDSEQWDEEFMRSDTDRYRRYFSNLRSIRCDKSSESELVEVILENFPLLEKKYCYNLQSQPGSNPSRASELAMSVTSASLLFISLIV